MGCATVFFWNLEKIKLKLKVLQQLRLLAESMGSSVLKAGTRPWRGSDKGTAVRLEHTTKVHCTETHSVVTDGGINV